MLSSKAWVLAEWHGWGCPRGAGRSKAAWMAKPTKTHAGAGDIDASGVDGHIRMASNVYPVGGHWLIGVVEQS
jgi:hypothetical protein